MANKTEASNSGQSQSNNRPQLRIVLIGGRELNGICSGKSSAGNIILGQNVFNTSIRTAQSEARQQEVFGRQITVVDTPGWWWFYPREDTPKLDQIEIQNSVHLCPPGPNVFLLVIPVGLNFSTLTIPSLKKHLELFSIDVFSHAIVLFTVVAPVSDKRIESDIKTDATLKWILHQCGDRKHVLNISNRDHRDQVKILIEKMETVVRQNRDRHFSVDVSHGNALREEIKLLEERASQRKDKAQKQRQKLRALIEGGKALPQHLKLVIIGAQYAARSSTGNTILGKNAFEVNKNGNKTMRCQINQGFFQEKQLTVVDSPGWFYNHTLQTTSEMDKLEIEKSVHLCPPGPHAILLVIVLATAINQSYKRAVSRHMMLFREEIWKHTIVVFTRGDWLGVKTVEERIESEEGLQWLVNKCGNRYHVLNNMDKSNKTQVKELIEKIEEMWVGNEDPCYKVDLNRGEQIQAEKEAGDKMAIRLKKINERKSRVLKEVYGRAPMQPVTDIRIVLVGPKCSGKSMAGNIILFKEMFDLSFTTSRLREMSEDHVNNTRPVKHQGNFDGVKVSVVETPGWFSDQTPPDWIKEQLLHGVSMCSPGPHVFLLVVPISRSFTKEDLKALVKVLKPLSERVWRYCMVLFTWGDWLSEFPVENYIVREGKELQKLLEKCGNRYHVLSPYRFGDPVPVKELFQKIIGIVKRNDQHFTTEVKQRKFQLLPWLAKEHILTEEEWKKRENELMEQVMKALTKEPEEGSLPSVRVAESMDDKKFPYMSGDVSSEYGSISEFRNQQAHDIVAEWLRNGMKHSEASSGIVSDCASSTHETLDEGLQVEVPFPVNSLFTKIKTPLRMSANTADVSRRNSF